jgi:hypothetical protein
MPVQQRAHLLVFGLGRRGGRAAGIGEREERHGPVVATLAGEPGQKLRRHEVEQRRGGHEIASREDLRCVSSAEIESAAFRIQLCGGRLQTVRATSARMGSASTSSHSCEPRESAAGSEALDPVPQPRSTIRNGRSRGRAAATARGERGRTATRRRAAHGAPASEGGDTRSRTAAHGST